MKVVTCSEKIPLAAEGMTGWREDTNQQAYVDMGYSGNERLKAGEILRKLKWQWTRRSFPESPIWVTKREIGNKEVQRSMRDGKDAKYNFGC